MHPVALMPCAVALFLAGFHDAVSVDEFQFENEEVRAASTGCSPNPCLNHGRCSTKPTGDAFCRCEREYHGEKCEKTISNYCYSVKSRSIFHRQEGVVTSPHYPKNYHPNQQCPYVIGDPDAKKITLTFDDVDMDPGTSLVYGMGPEISFDTGKNTRVKTKPASPIVLKTDRVWLFFRTNSLAQAHKGFKFHYKIEKVRCTPNLCQNGGTCAEKPDGGYYCKCKDGFDGEKCDDKKRIVCPLESNRYMYDRKEGVLKSPGYPQNYPADQRCPYFIGAPDAKKITLTFDDVDVDQRERPDTFLSYGTGAKIDFHNVESIDVKTKPASPIVLNTNRVWLFFHTNWPVQAHKGFKLHFKIDTAVGCTPNPCQNGAPCAEKPDGSYYCKCKEGFQLEKCNGKKETVCPLEPKRYMYDRKEGVLKSPGYPRNYPGNQRCPYFIGAPDAKKITLTFEDVDLNPGDWPDAFIVYGTGPEVSFYRPGKDTPVKTKPASPIVLHTDRVFVYFYTKSRVEAHKGFKLHFKIE